MCGIVGYYRKDNVSEPLTELELATQALAKRGPDYSSLYHQKNVGLGHTRLSIIDTSSSANQPFIDNTGRYVLIFNGEIYNFILEKRKLEKEGIEFKTNSDTEVLLELYKKYKSSVTNYLNGFYAFAIHDKEENTIFIARDRMGIKPLFLYEDESKLIFASELKAILAFDVQKKDSYPIITSLFSIELHPRT